MNETPKPVQEVTIPPELEAISTLQVALEKQDVLFINQVLVRAWFNAGSETERQAVTDFWMRLYQASWYEYPIPKHLLRPQSSVL